MLQSLLDHATQAVATLRGAYTVTLEFDALGPKGVTIRIDTADWSADAPRVAAYFASIYEPGDHITGGADLGFINFVGRDIGPIYCRAARIVLQGERLDWRVLAPAVEAA